MLKKHLLTWIITFAVWFTFVLGGLPSDYYQTWALVAHLCMCVFVFIMIIPLTYFVLRMIWKENYLRSSVWIAFYGSIPLVLYDYVYVGLTKGLGFSYLSSHWYLTIFYFIVWIEIPLIGWIMEKKRNGTEEKACDSQPNAV